eukprot:jgi/Tetstr1/454279/TSEL_041198.t1
MAACTVDVYLLCYNEAVILPHTIRHYRQWLPECRITVLDNHSTDGSGDIARAAGCHVHLWKQRPGKMMDDVTNASLKNNIWRTNGTDADWVICADMDEWLCVRPEDLERERAAGVTVLTTFAVNGVCFSEREDLSDIDPLECAGGHVWKYGHKKLCFHRPSVSRMNYSLGAHHARPVGTVVHSKTRYLIKHMQFLGLPYYRRKMLQRSERNKGNVATHYTTSESSIRNRYMRKVQRMQPFAVHVPTYSPPPTPPDTRP